MITNASVAKQVIDLMAEIKDKLMDSMTAVKELASPEEYQAYREAVGRVVYSILANVIEPLYSANPGLKPPEWDP